MTQKLRLKLCNWSLLPLTVLMLLSGIQLEVLHGTRHVWIWIHIAVGILFMAFCGWHIWLHFKKSNWFARFRKLKNQATRLLWGVSLITFLTGIIAAIHWCIFPVHVPIGGVHGKIGFLMIILVIFHALKRKKFYFLYKSNSERGRLGT